MFLYMTDLDFVLIMLIIAIVVLCIFFGLTDKLRSKGDEDKTYSAGESFKKRNIKRGTKITVKTKGFNNTAIVFNGGGEVSSSVRVIEIGTTDLEITFLRDFGDARIKIVKKRR